MKKCAILTMDSLDEFVAYDKKLDMPMITLGWQLDYISWHKENVNWNQYQAVIIRSTWDYQNDIDAFLKVLETIDNSSAKLLNSLNIVHWNVNKNYLKQVDAKGASIVPTLWVDKFDYTMIGSYFTEFGTQQIVIKPTVSANSDNTFWLKDNTYHENKEILKQSLKNRQLMVQPFVPAIIEQGEYSIFYFAGKYSHSILKKPKSGDFRVQEEHGGLLMSVKPNKKLLSVAERALNTIPEKVLYARIDLVEYQGHYRVMEIELIEPSLYFNLCEDAASKFSQAFAEWMQ